MTSSSRYPARIGGVGAARVHDLLARGLAEAGHIVYYRVSEGYAESPPDGVVATDRTIRNADLYHLDAYPEGGAAPHRRKPWLRTVHEPYWRSASLPLEHLIFVSKAQAASYGSSRYVWNGVDPDEFIYSEVKDDYFLFIVSDLQRADEKGLPTAIAVAEKTHVHLVVAGEINVNLRSAKFKSANVTYVGEVGGEEKAMLLAGARALLFPGLAREPFGLVVAESLVSGTPVISGRGGALPELVQPNVGFTCRTIDDYAEAIANIGRISSATCRSYAQREFHYSVMTRRYIAEYETELGGAGSSRTK